jgi:hypothetical protein
MVKRAAMKTILLLRQCSPSIAENFTVTVRNMDATLIEKSCMFELPSTLPQPNARNFQTSWKRKMIGHKAVLQEEVDAAVMCRRKSLRQ